jgi:hypothetical protein
VSPGRVAHPDRPLTDLRCQAAVKFELVINHKTAKTFGLDVPWHSRRESHPAQRFHTARVMTGPLPLPQLWSASPLRADLSGPEALGRCVPSVDGSGLARRIFTSQAWSVRPCEATAKAVEELAITKEWVLAKLKENAINALKVKGGSPVANRALELLGKELGMFIDRAEISQANEFGGMSLDEMRVELVARARRLGLDRELAGLLEGPADHEGDPALN